MFRGYFKGKDNEAQNNQTTQSSQNGAGWDDGVPDQQTLLPMKPSPLLENLTLAPRSDKKNEIEYLYIEENPFGIKTPRPTGSFGPFPMRTNSDKLLYGTGILYLTGIVGGGIYGFNRGLNLSRGYGSTKLRFNSVLNQVTRYGPWAANSLGVLAMSWACLDMGVAQFFKGGDSDWRTQTSAAALAGAIFKSTAGLRPALIASGVMAATVGTGAWVRTLSSSPLSVLQSA